MLLILFSTDSASPLAILKYLNVHSTCYLLTDALHFNAVDLADRIQAYMTANVEVLLESRILGDLDPRVVCKLSERARGAQTAQSPVSRSEKLGHAALEKLKDWLSLQDVPVPIIPSQMPWVAKDASKMSPPGSVKKTVGQQLGLVSLMTSPVLRPSLTPPLLLEGDDIFVMEWGIPQTQCGADERRRRGEHLIDGCETGMEEESGHASVNSLSVRSDSI